VGIGAKLVGGKARRRQSVRIYVERKLDECLLPEPWRIPRDIGGVPTDVIEVGRFAASCDESGGGANRRERRPVWMGASAGHDRIMAGTFGAVLRLEGGADGRRFLLSNNHVLANENQLGTGAPIFQPGLEDLDGAAPSQVAALTKFVQLRRTGANKVDCAIAELLEGVRARADLIGLGGAYDRTAVRARKGMRVVKTGRTTGVTRGIVEDVDCDVTVDFAHLGPIWFEDQVLIAPHGSTDLFSCEGDSGALIVTDDAKRSPVGLLFASAERTGYSLACHLVDVMVRLDVDGVALELA
jgi:hypothetical protein